ncbi:MAG TPA: NAD-dependent epimerase/dehydratase family protein [bacterium]|nr:NAD-dependent epimerase/dehydratase family protein [bacterium]HPG44841.1 NAD-dependent epimerase/dehydratase family protein [bacterium]HPM98130.1 NAD-dependent epimerase/dehydratase family protein [bacterium]
MKILVTGGAGFIGSNLVDACLQEGHQVYVVDNFSTGRRENLPADVPVYPFNIQDPKMDDLFRQEKFEAVFHEAAQMDVRRSVQDPIFDAQNNILGTINLLQCCAKYHVGKVIFASSGGAIYGEQVQFPATESHPLAPYSPYGITKLAGEKYLFFYALNYGLQYVALRYANVYGPRQNPRGEAGVVAIFTRMLIDGEQPTINGDGEQTRDFVFVKDVVAANLKALKYGKNGMFNIGTGKESTIKQVFHLLVDLVGAEAAEKYGPAMSGEQFRSLIDPTLAAKELGWQPTTDLQQGLRETVDFFRLQNG